MINIFKTLIIAVSICFTFGVGFHFDESDLENPEHIVIIYTEDQGHLAIAKAIRAILALKNIAVDIYSTEPKLNVNRAFKPGSWQDLISSDSENKSIDIDKLTAEFLDRAQLHLPIFSEILSQKPYKAILSTSINPVALEQIKSDLPRIVIITDLVLHPPMVLAPSKLSCFQALLRVLRDQNRTYAAHPNTTYVVASELSHSQLSKEGVPSAQLFKSHLMPVDPKFYKNALSKRGVKKKLGLPDKPVIFFIEGSCGNENMKKYLEKIGETKEFYGVFAPGINRKLREELRHMIKERSIKNAVVLDYITNVHEYMRACEVIVGKCGGSSSAEAIASGTILVCNRANLMINEQYNFDIIASYGLAVPLKEDLLQGIRDGIAAAKTDPFDKVYAEKWMNAFADLVIEKIGK